MNNTENALNVIFSKNLSKKILLEEVDKALYLKKQIDDLVLVKVQKSLKGEEEMKMDDLVGEIMDNLDEKQKDVFERILTGESEQDQKLNPNLILSEIFPNGKGKEDSKPVPQDLQVSMEPMQMSLLQLSKIQENFWQENFKKYDTKKLTQFFKFLKKYNIKISFDMKDKDNIEGALLLTIHSNDKFFNNFIFKDFFVKFVNQFVNDFKDDFEAEIEQADFTSQPQLILICSYNKDMCFKMERMNIFESIAQNYELIKPENHHIFIKIFMNFIINYPPSINRIINLKIYPIFLQKLKDETNPNTLSLYLQALNLLSANKVHPQNILSRKSVQLLLDRLTAKFVDNEAIRILSYKNRNNRSQFKPAGNQDSFIIKRLYKKIYTQMITEVCSLNDFEDYYNQALFILNFMSRSFKIFQYCPPQNSVITQVFSMCNMFFFVHEILEKGLKSLIKLINSSNIRIFLEELFKTEIQENIFSVLEREILSEESLNVMTYYQKLIQFLIETCQLSGITLKLKDIRMLMDFIHRIKLIIFKFFKKMKEKKLSKSLIKYVEKIDQFKNGMFFKKIDLVMSQNAFLLQKLSHSHDLDDYMFVELMKIKKQFFNGKNEIYEDRKLEEFLKSSLMIIYVASKVDRKKGYLEDVNEYINLALNKIDYILQDIQQDKKILKFEILIEIQDFIFLCLFFIKTQDEKLEEDNSVKVFNQVLKIQTFIFSNASIFVNLQSNHQIMSLLESFYSFWYLSYNFDIKMYDQSPIFLIKNLKKIPVLKIEKRKTFQKSQIYEFINALSGFIDLKTKCYFFNFIIIKQLDIIFNQESLETINRMYLVNTIKKALDNSYSKDIHQIDSDFLLGLSDKIMEKDEIRTIYLRFIFKNDLFYNQLICDSFKKVLDKNYRFEDLGEEKHTKIQAISYMIREEEPQDQEKFINFLFKMAQNNITKKKLFENLLKVIIDYFKKYPSDTHKELAYSLFKDSNIFNKLVRLHKKNLLNLSKILKFLLKIISYFELTEKVEIPQRIISSIMKSENFEQFQEIQNQILLYVIEKNLYEDFQESIEQFFINIKIFLDDYLYFSNKPDYSNHLKTIYYGLKNIQKYNTLSAQILNINPHEFVVRYVLQLFDENYKLELTPINNLYLYFNNYDKDNNAKEHLKFELKIVKIIMNILKDNEIDHLEDDFFVMNKILSFFFYGFEEYEQKDYQKLYIKYINLGINAKKDNLFKSNFYDFFLVLYFRFYIDTDTLEKKFLEYLQYDTVNEFLKDQMEYFTSQEMNFQPIGYNDIIRRILKIHYILNNFEENLQLIDYKNVISTLNSLFIQHYSEIHKIPKFEKLLVEIYIIIRNKKNILSVLTAGVFVDIFSNKADFQLTSVVDQFIFMGLFNRYFKKIDREMHWVLNIKLLSLEGQKLPQLPENYQELDFKLEIIQKLLKQLQFEGFDESKELIIFQFLDKISTFQKNLLEKLNFDENVMKEKFKEIRENLQNLENCEIQDIILIFYKIQFLNIAIWNKVQSYQTGNYSFLNEIEQISQLLPKSIKTITRTGFYLELNQDEKLTFIKFVFEFYEISYKMVTLENNAKIKKFLLDQIAENYIVIDQTNFEDEIVMNVSINVARLTIKIMQNKFDEVRISQHQKLLFTCLDFLKSKSIENYYISLQSEDYEYVDLPKDYFDSFRKLPFEEQNNVGSLFEYVLFIFIQVSKNEMLVENSKKEEYFEILRDKKGIFEPSQCAGSMINQLYNCYEGEGMEFSLIQGKVGRDKDLNLKQRNILFLHKLLQTIQKNLVHETPLSPKEEKFLEFAFEGILVHLEYDLDSEIFYNFDLFPIMIDIFISLSIQSKFKITFMNILEIYLEKTGKANKIDPLKIEKFFYFHEQLIFDKFPDCVNQFYELVQVCCSLIELRQEFLDTFFDKMSFSLFQAKNPMSVNVFICSLFFYNSLLKNYDIQHNYDQLSHQIYQFIKINHRNMKLQEKALFGEIICQVKNKSLKMDHIQFKNMIMLVRIQYQNEKADVVEKTVEILHNISQIDPFFEIVFQKIGFENFIKLVVRKYGSKESLIEPIASIFLIYTNQLCKQKITLFDMYDTLSIIQKNIRFYHKIEIDHIVLTYYKCLVNASHQKKNANYLINNGIAELIKDCNYDDNREFFKILAALLFNLSHVFDTNEIDLNLLFTQEVQQLMFKCYKTSLKKQYKEILGEYIDIQICLIRQGFIQYFNSEFVRQIKLTINFYYQNQTVLIKYLNIIKNLTIQDVVKSKAILSQEFDYSYLYQIHYRYIKNTKINILTKTIILNLLNFMGDSAKERDLIIYGIPENIIHTFSMADNPAIILLNLKIILFSLKFEKCIQYIRDKFILICSNIMLRPEMMKITEDLRILQECQRINLKILYVLIEFYQDCDILDIDFYFDQLSPLFELIAKYYSEEDVLFVLLMMILSKMKNDPDQISSLNSNHYESISHLLKNRKSQTDTRLYPLSIKINDLLEREKSFKEQKYDLLDFQAELNEKEKMRLDFGDYCDIFFENKIYKKCKFKYDFTKMCFSISKVPFHDFIDNKDKTFIYFQSKNVQKIDSYEEDSLSDFQEKFRMYFQKKISDKLFFNISFWIFNQKQAHTREIYLIFENEYQNDGWKDLMKKIMR